MSEEGDVLHVSGTAPSEEAKQRLWDEYGRIDPEMRSGDLVMNIEVGGGAGGGGEAESYTVKSGDTLSKIGQRHGVAWREIFEANKDQLDDPDKIFPGQTLRIPRK
ncbi:MAG TPA: LysM peptidoglycan-binding domain-containing protein [Pyrinomonadaceae bacterium]